MNETIHMLMKKLFVFIATMLMSFPIQGRVMLVSDPTTEVLLELDSTLYAFWHYYREFTELNAYGEAEVIPNVYDGQSSWLRDTHYRFAPTYRTLIIPDAFSYKGYQRIPQKIHRMGHYLDGLKKESYENNYLELVRLNRFISELPDSCFYKCVKLREFYFSEGIDKSLCYINTMAFGRCPELSIRLPRFCSSVSQTMGSQYKYHFLSEIGDSIRRLEVVWSNPPLLEEAARVFENPERLKPMFQYVDTLVVPKGCKGNYADWTDVKFGVLQEGDYEAEGNYPNQYEWYARKSTFSVWLYNEPRKVGIHDVYLDSLDYSGEIDRLYDLQGRRLAAPPKKGVYIENGRKRVAK